jgi:hypothetical protein
VSDVMSFLLAMVALIGPLCLAWFVVGRYLEPRRRDKHRETR